VCDVSECHRETSIMRRPLPTRDCCAMKKQSWKIVCLAQSNTISITKRLHKKCLLMIGMLITLHTVSQSLNTSDDGVRPIFLKVDLREDNAL